MMPTHEASDNLFELRARLGRTLASMMPTHEASDNDFRQEHTTRRILLQ